jgi:hypothetical protein
MGTSTLQPVYLELWRPEGGYIRVPDEDRDGFFGEKSYWGGSCPCIDLTALERDEDRAKLAAAAPACVRALLDVEWSLPGLEGHMQCPDCDGFQPSGIKKGDRPYYSNREGHKTDPERAVACPVDVALTEAGLPTQVERDEMRRLLAALRKASAAAALTAAFAPTPVG